MADLLQEIEAQFADARAITRRQSIGVVREVGDGVARVEGLADVMLNEMVDFGRGIIGLALNLDETEVGVGVLGDYTRVRARDAGRTPWTANARSPARRPTLSRSGLPESSAAAPWGSRCRPASWPSTR